MQKPVSISLKVIYQDEEVMIHCTATGNAGEYVIGFDSPLLNTLFTANTACIDVDHYYITDCNGQELFTNFYQKQFIRAVGKIMHQQTQHDGTQQ